MMRTINPEELGAPKGYSNGLLVPAGSDLLFVAGQIGWDSNQEIVSEDFSEQFNQALQNVVAADSLISTVCRTTASSLTTFSTASASRCRRRSSESKAWRIQNWSPDASP